MNKFFILFFSSLLFFSISSISQTPTDGSLVIVGGGLEHTNKSIFNQMISLAGGAEKASFAIIPSASGTPIQSYAYFKNVLISYGIKPGNIHLVKIAMMDDDSTTDVNESEWKDNGNDPRMAELVRKCSVVWFSGGDQLRTMKALVRHDGSKTPVLDAVWEVYRSGGVIGGTSAGAAIMSEAMIGGGNSLGALTHGVITDYLGDDFPEGDGVLMTKGLGFFPAGIVDQHFHKRARIARLVVALMNEKPRYNLGFGIDENTALIYIGSQNLVKVAGAAGVTIINATNAGISYIQKLPDIKNLSVSYLDEGDSYDVATGVITPAVDKKPTRGNEYYKVHNPGQAGMLSGYSNSFPDLVTVNLIDNKSTDTIRNTSFSDQNAGFQVTLSKTPASAGYYIDRAGDGEHYTVTNIRMDITPVQVSVAPLK